MEKLKVFAAQKGECKYLFKAVFKFKNNAWEYVIGKLLSSEDQCHDHEIKYKNVRFFCREFKKPLTEVMEEIYAGYSFCCGMTCTAFKADVSWEERLIPSHRSKSISPVRIYSTRILGGNEIQEEKLLGYDMGFRPSFKGTIREFLDLPKDGASSEIREGAFFVELEDTRGKISINNGAISIEPPSENLRLIGEINAMERVFLKGGETKEIVRQDALELWLIDQEENVLDYVSLSEYPYAFIPTADDQKASYSELIEEGEGIKCEFKVYTSVSKKRDSKAAEITNTVCAFSNEQGGFLFIGILDDGCIKGVSTEVKKDYKTDCETGLKRYISDLKKHLKESLKYSDCFSIEFAEIHTQTIIVISVKQVVSHDVNYVLDGKDAYIRKGATSAKMTPVEIRSRSSSSKDVFFAPL